MFFRRVSFLQPLTLLALGVQVFFLILLISAILSAGTVKVSSKKQQPASIALSGLENLPPHTHICGVSNNDKELNLVKLIVMQPSFLPSRKWPPFFPFFCVVFQHIF